MLTQAQKAAGKAFRAQWCKRLGELAEAFPAATCPPFTVWYRHDCKDRGSWALFLRQQYAPSPDGLFAFIYRHSTCPHCRFEVRSTGMLVPAEGNPPEKGAVIHAHYELSAVPVGQADSAGAS